MMVCRWHRFLAALLGASLAVCAPPSPGRAQSTLPVEKVELLASDGVRTAGFWYDCGTTGAPAVLLLHDNGRDHFAWAPLVEPLVRAGIHVLALDLRGHAASGALAPAEREQLLGRDPAVYREMLLDAQAAVAYLQTTRRIPPAKIAVLGAELGSGIGFALMASQPKLRGMVSLSPQQQGYGYQTLELVKSYGKRPLLIFTTKAQYAEASQQIAATLQKTGLAQVVFYPGRDVRGTAMLGQGVNVEPSIRNFLTAAFGLKD